MTYDRQRSRLGLRSRVAPKTAIGVNVLKLLWRLNIVKMFIEFMRLTNQLCQNPQAPVVLPWLLAVIVAMLVLVLAVPSLISVLLMIWQ